MGWDTLYPPSGVPPGPALSPGSPNYRGPSMGWGSLNRDQRLNPLTPGIQAPSIGSGPSTSLNAAKGISGLVDAGLAMAGPPGMALGAIKSIEDAVMGGIKSSIVGGRQNDITNQYNADRLKPGLHADLHASLNRDFQQQALDADSRAMDWGSLFGPIGLGISRLVSNHSGVQMPDAMRQTAHTVSGKINPQLAQIVQSQTSAGLPNYTPGPPSLVPGLPVGMQPTTIQ